MDAPETYIVTLAQLAELDSLYDNRAWNSLVEQLRSIRRKVEAGTIVSIEGTQATLKTWQDFYTWAHGRFYLLEEGSDRWIGNDD